MRSFGPCGQSPRRLGALATKIDESCGLANFLRMSEPTFSSPAGRPADVKNSAGTGGKLLAFFGWLAFLCGIALFAIVSFVRFEHRDEADRRYALADEQRSVAGAAAALAKNLAGGSISAVSSDPAATPSDSGVSALRTRSLELIARAPPESDVHLRSERTLQAEWTRLAKGIDALQGEWARILDFQSELAALQETGDALRASADRLADALAGRGGGMPGEAQALALAARRFAEEVRRASLAEPARLDRAGELLDVHVRVRERLVAEMPRIPPVTASRSGRGRTPTLHTGLADFDARLDAAVVQLDATRKLARTLESASAETRHLAEGSARVMELLPGFEARTRREPEVLGRSLDAWLLWSAALVLAGLLALFGWRQRLLRFSVAGLDQAWGEAAESDWRARGLVLDLLRTIHSLEVRPTKGAAPAADSEDLEGSVREAKASLPRIVARRSQLAAALLSAREPLGTRLSAARDSVLAHLGSGPGALDTAALRQVEATFRECTLFAMAALAGEIRAAASEGAPGGEAAAEAAAIRASIHAANEAETIHDVVARGFELLEWSLERVLAGEEEERVALIFLLDDLRVVRGKAPFSSGLDFDPDLARPPETGRPGTERPGTGGRETGGGETGGRETEASEGPVLKSDAARMLPSFRKGLAEWTKGDGDGASAAMLVRGSVSVLARAAEEEMSPARPFWRVAAAFCTALCERAIPAGPAVRRIMGEVSRAFEETAEREEAPQPPDRLLRELLIYVALAESHHEELEEVRAAFELDRYPLAVPERPPSEADPAEAEEEGDISVEIIQQLEGIRAALDRINRPPESPSRPPAD